MRTRSAVIGFTVLFALPCLALALAAHLSGSAAAAVSETRSCLTPAARSLLSRIEQQFGSMQIVSTCRPGAKIAGTGRTSRHASGNAVDFNAGSRKSAVIAWLIANHKSGGTMTYPNMDHVHVDIGPRFVSLARGRTRAAWGNPDWQNSRMSLGRQ